jgi:predicted AlkP superfamily pyrophosphatase or phosphodiesterase
VLPRSNCLKRRLRHANAVLLILLILSVCLINVGQTPRVSARLAPPRTERVIVISLDGLDARYLSKRDEFGLQIPTLRRLMADGATASGVVSVYPSVTYPAHTTLVTGARPARHGIYGNEEFQPLETSETRDLQWFASAIKADTLWDAAARRKLKTAMVSWPVSVGAGDYNFPEILKIDGSFEQTLKLIKANDRPQEFVEELEKRDPQLYSNLNKDEGDDMRTRFAEFIITEKRPDLLLVHLFDLDHFQHDFGPFTPEAFAMLEKVDGYVGRILAAAKRAGTLNDTAIFIVSDHGFMPIRQQAHPGVLLAEAGLVKVRQETDINGEVRSVITSWRAMSYVTSGSCSIILRDPKDKDALRKARAIFKSREGKTGSGIFRVVEAKEIRQLGGNPRAAFMIDAAEGFTFGHNFSGPFITDTDQRGQHGFLPTRPNYRTSFIMTGSIITRRGDLGEVRMIDIAPTIARVRNLWLKNSEGRALSVK